MPHRADGAEARLSRCAGRSTPAPSGRTARSAGRRRSSRPACGGTRCGAAAPPARRRAGRGTAVAAEQRAGVAVDRRGAEVAGDLGLHAARPRRSASSGRRSPGGARARRASRGRPRRARPRAAASGRRRRSGRGSGRAVYQSPSPTSTRPPANASISSPGSCQSAPASARRRLRQRDRRRELALVERVRIGDREAGRERAQLDGGIADLERRVLERDAPAARLRVPRERRPGRGRVLADARAPQQEAGRPHERDAVAARAGTAGRGIAEGRAEARALRHERRD